MGSTSAHNNEGLGRRDLIKRSAALGLIAVPTMSFLSACASGSGDSDDNKVAKGEKSDKNPLAVNGSAPLEIVIFDGGFGTKYAEEARDVYKKTYPEAQIKFSATQKIQSVLQPRFNGGTPPDLIDNSGAQQMDTGVLVGKKQLTDLTPLLDAPPSTIPPRRSATPCGPASSRWVASTATRSGSCTTPTRSTASGTRRPRWTSWTPRTRRPGTRCSRSVRRRRRRASRAGPTPASTRTTSRSRSTPSSPRSAASRS